MSSLLLLLVCLALIAPPVARGAGGEEDPGLALEREVAAALADGGVGGWAELPREVWEAGSAGPVPGRRVGPDYVTTDQLWFNSRPAVQARDEAWFKASVERFHAGAGRVIWEGSVLLVDSSGRVWAVSGHAPHLLQWFDGETWGARRVDGLDVAALNAAGGGDPALAAWLESDYMADGTTNRNDAGLWLPGGAEDAAGNLHFVGGCESDAAKSQPGGAAGWGIHTLRADGTWAFHAIFTDRDDGTAIDRARFVPLDPDLASGDLMAFTSLRLSDAEAARYGYAVRAMPATADDMRRQQWEDVAEEGRAGPLYVMKFGPVDGGEPSWRAERTQQGYGIYDAAEAAWVRPDGRAFVPNRFGLWVHWPAELAARRAGELMPEVLAGNVGAREELVSMGDHAVPALVEAAREAGEGDLRRELGTLQLRARAVGRGEEEAVPLIQGRWRFRDTWPLATMPDGRFAFRCGEAEDVTTGETLKDAVVVYDPGVGPDGGFDVRVPSDGNTNVASGNGTVLDRAGGVGGGGGGGLWGWNGRRIAAGGEVQRLAPPGLEVDYPDHVDAEGRVYMGHRPVRVYAHPADAAGQALAADAVRERVFEGVQGLYANSDVPAPWTAVALDGEGLLRLDGPEPTRVAVPEIVSGKRAPPGERAAVVLQDGVIVGEPGGVAWLDGAGAWHEAEDLGELVRAHGRELAASAPVRARPAGPGADENPFNLFFLAGDGRGGLWLAWDFLNGDGPRRVWHWTPPADGAAGEGTFTDLAELLPVPVAGEVGRGVRPVMSTTAGRLLIEIEPGRRQVQTPTGPAVIEMPGAFAEVATPADRRTGRAQGDDEARWEVLLVAALDRRITLISEVWSDRDGFVWSTLFDNPLVISRNGPSWKAKQDMNRIRRTTVPASFSAKFLLHPPGGRIWAGTAAAVSPAYDGTPDTLAVDRWANWPDARAGGELLATVAGADGAVYALQARGVTRLRVVGEGEKAKVEAAGSAAWGNERNAVGEAAAAGGGVWTLPEGNRLIYTPVGPAP